MSTRPEKQPTVIYDVDGNEYTITPKARAQESTSKRLDTIEVKLKNAEARADQLEKRVLEVNTVLVAGVIVLAFMVAGMLLQWIISNNELVRYNNSLPAPTQQGADI